MKHRAKVVLMLLLSGLVQILAWDNFLSRYKIVYCISLIYEGFSLYFQTINTFQWEVMKISQIADVIVSCVIASSSIFIYIHKIPYIYLHAGREKPLKLFLIG